MRKSLQAILFIKSFGTGIAAPVLMLAMLSHGATVRNLSLLLGAYSFMVIAAEFPTGLFADLYGRKRAFVVSSGIQIGSYTLLLLANNGYALLGAMVLSGLGRAFASGSLDALAIDEAADDATLVRITSRLSILESAGLAIGALVGGGLATLGEHYNANLGLNALLSVVLLFLTILTVKEKPRRVADRALPAAPRMPRAVEGSLAASGDVPASDENSMRYHRPGLLVRQSLAFLKRRGLVRALIVLALLTGFAMLTLETYWQSALAQAVTAKWLFGAVDFAGFAAVMLGSRLVERLLTRSRRAGVAVLLGFRALLGVALMLLVPSRGAGMFVATYMLGYLFLGGGGVAEGMLLNRETPSEQRASILSLFSFVLQIGGLLASLLGYWVSAATDFRAMWLIAGALLVAANAVFALFYARGGLRSSETLENRGASAEPSER